MRRPPTWVFAVALLALPFAVLALRAVVGVDHTPGGDASLIELRTRDVGTVNSPTLGSYGRFGFNHPGPLWFYALAIPYRLTGQLELGVLLVGVVSVAAIAWVAARRDRLWWAALLTAVLVFGLGSARVADAWEPHGLILPCAALLLLTFDTVSGRAWSLPLVAGVASLLGAAQATLLPYAAALGAVALWSARRHVRPVLATVAVLIVLWSPTIWQQWTGEPTNITQLRDARDQDGLSLGLADAWDLVAIELGHMPPWVGFRAPVERFTGTVDVDAAPLVPIGAVALLVVLARRRTRTPMVIVVAIATVAAVAGMSQLLGPAFVWIPQWLRVIGFGCWLAIGWEMAPRVPRRALAAATALVVVASTVDAVTHRDEPDHLADAVRLVVTQLPPVRDPILVSSTVDANAAFGGAFDGLEVLVLEIERRGIETVVDPRLANRFGPHRAEKARARGREVLLVDADRGDAPPGFVRIGLVDPLPAELREERSRLLRRLGLPLDASAARIVRAGGRDPDRRRLADRLVEIPNLPRVELLLSPDAART